MKTTALLLALFLAAIPAASAGQKVDSKVTLGSQPLTLPAGSDTVIVPQFLPAPVGSFVVSAVSSASGQATLALSEKTLLDNYGVPLRENEFQYASGLQPVTYYVLVTSGNLRGTCFTVSSNTPTTITVGLQGLPVVAADVKEIDLCPSWRLASLFPPDQAGISFVTSPNGDPDASSMAGVTPTRILLPDFAGSGVNRPPIGSYFFNDQINDWASTSTPGVPAGEVCVMPGQYVILSNQGANSFSLQGCVAGSAFDKHFAFYLATLANAPQDNYLALPRAVDYKISQMGFTDSNFIQSVDKSPSGRRDELVSLQPDGSMNATYYKFKNKWYDAGNDASPVDPLIPAGTALLVRKAASDGGSKLWINK